MRTECALDRQNSKDRSHSRPYRRLALVAGGFCMAGFMLSACDGLDGLMDVDLPGQILEEHVGDPSLAVRFVEGAQAEFECALQGQLVTIDGHWAGSYHVNNNILESVQYEGRSSTVRFLGNGNCTDTRDWVWRPMHAARVLAADAAHRIEEVFPAGSVANEDFLVGKARAYEGYAIQMLSEAFCGIVFDGDEVIRSREDGFRAAEARFTTAMDRALRVTSGPDLAEAQEIVNMALVGRARARLNLGDHSGALQDAGQVDEGFVRYATYDASPGRRTNMVNHLQNEHTVHTRYRNLEVDGVPDPRVPVENTGQTGVAGLERWRQLKYTDQGTDIPFATWREAQLMIAEISGGQTAVGIINALRETWDLPSFSSSDEQDIHEQVLEERRRELFLQGTKIGDDLRTGKYQEWDTGTTPVGRTIAADETCLPVPDVEFF